MTLQRTIPVEDPVVEEGLAAVVLYKTIRSTSGTGRWHESRDGGNCESGGQCHDHDERGTRSPSELRRRLLYAPWTSCAKGKKAYWMSRNGNIKRNYGPKRRTRGGFSACPPLQNSEPRRQHRKNVGTRREVGLRN